MNQINQFLPVFLFFLSVHFSFGQTTTPQKKNEAPYIVWVKPLNSSHSIKGYLSSVEDTLVISSLILNKPTTQIRLDEVEKLKFRKKGKLGKSVLIGGVAGFGLGALVGAITYQPCNSQAFLGCAGDLGRGFNIAGGSLLGGILGLTIGGIAGSNKIIIPIKGSNKSIEDQKKEILKYKFGGR